MHLIVIFILLLTTFLPADIYDEYKLSQDANKSKNHFFTNDFDEIIRFDAIIFENNNLTAESLEALKKITQKIYSYTNKKRKFYVTVIGHTSSTTDDKNEKRIDSDTYANRIQNSLKDSFDINQSLLLSRSYAKKIKKHLVDNGVDENIIELECREDLDKLFSDEIKMSKLQSNRVMISLYVEEDLDLDDDGVVNSRDLCKESKKGNKVDVDGCEIKPKK